jgi:phospholipase/carboxylesterase
MSQDTTPLLLGEALQSATVLCVVVHGRGQSPELMAEHIVGRLDTKGVAYILPRAASKSWYNARALDALTQTTRDQLATSLDQIRQAVAMAPVGVPVVLVGFSQGACLVLEYSFAFGPWRGALLSLTGCRVGLPSDDRPQLDLSGMPVYLSAGEKDPWIPLPFYAQAALELGSVRARLRTDVFPGRDHEVSNTEIDVLQSVLNQLLQGREVRW